MEFNEFEIRMLVVSMPAKKRKKIHKITPPNCEFFTLLSTNLRKKKPSIGLEMGF